MTTALPRRQALALAATPWLGACAAPPPQAAPVDAAARLQGPAVVLPGTLWQDLRDPASGDTWRITVLPPLLPPPPGGHAVLYVLDGQRSFALAAQLARITLDRPADVRGDVPIVVGLDLPTDTMDVPARRRRYTPPAEVQADAWHAASHPANALLGFLAGLQARVAAQWPVHPARQTLFGHSITGLFAAYALLARGGALFGRYAAGSPSLWQQGDAAYWQRLAQHLLARQPAPSHPAQAKVQVQLSVGELEAAAHAPSAQRAARLAERRPIDSVRHLATLLHSFAPQTMSVRLSVYPGLDHGAVMPRALLDAFELARQPAP
ncbi:MAG: alpha/beta hydrolase-fold protein [Pseudomonadota bacterium]|nr:alpha/beta hydrolase-fold protein [Pseudomonadota bacterium]